MEIHHVKALECGFEDLVASLQVDHVKVTLFAKGILLAEDLQEIKKETKELEKVFLLVNILKKRGPEAYPTFIIALTKYDFYNHLVLKLEKLAKEAMAEDKSKDPAHETVETKDINVKQPTTEENRPGSNALRNRIELHLPRELTDWKFVGRNLGISSPKLSQIERDNHNQREQIVAMLTEWFQNGENRELPFLAQALLDAGRRDLSEWVTALNPGHETVEKKDVKHYEVRHWKFKKPFLDYSECETVKSISYFMESPISQTRNGTSVFFGVFKNKVVAVKKVVRHVVEKEEHIIEKMKNVDIPHVLQILCFEMDMHFAYIVSPLCVCDLQYLIETKEWPIHRALTIEKRMELSAQLIDGVQNLHDLDIIHRDLKPQNVLVDEYLSIHIADFGKSRLFSLCDTTVVTGPAGTMAWMPTENQLESSNRRSKKAGDIQVTGYLLYYILSDGHHPFESCHPYSKDIVKLLINLRNRDFQLNHSLLMKHYPSESLEILKEMLSVELERRPSLIRCHLKFKVPITTTFEKFLAIFSTYLTTSLTNDLCDKFNIEQPEKQRIISSKVPGFSFLKKLEKEDIIKRGNVSSLEKPLEKMVQALVKLKDYQTQVQKNEEDSSSPREAMTLEEKTDIFVVHLRKKIKVWYESTCPIPWKKTCDKYLQELFTDIALFKTTQDSKLTQFHVDQKSLIEYSSLLTSDQGGNYILVEGDPGSGKTILTAQLAFDWCEGKFSEINMLIPLSLKLVENMTLAEAVKELWFHDEIFLTTGDIGQIMQCGKRCFMFDGAEEYIAGDGAGDSLHGIDKLMKGFEDMRCKVVVTARSGYFSDKSDGAVFRMGKLVEQSRSSYIEKTFPKEDRQMVSSLIEDHPMLRHFCTVPLLFVLTLHNLQYLKTEYLPGQSHSITHFMKHIMRAFCPFPRSRDESKMKTLAEIAFHGLCRRRQKLLWRKEFIERNVQNMREYFDSGILVVDEVFSFTKFSSGGDNMNTNTASDYQDEGRNKDTVLCKNPQIETGEYFSYFNKLYASNQRIENEEFPKVPLHVRFLHKIIQEWFAAIYVSSVITRGDQEEIRRHLELIDESTLHYMLRFVCGMCDSNSHHVFDHLTQKIIKETAKCPMILNCIALCFVESSSSDTIFPYIEKLISQYPMVIKSDEDEILQIAKVKLLEMASHRKLTIVNLDLLDVLESVTKTELRLRAGTCIRRLDNVTKVRISEWDVSWQNEERHALIIDYLVQSNSIREVELHFPSDPPLLYEETIKSIACSNIKVTWKIGNKFEHILDTQNGEWILKKKEKYLNTLASDSNLS